MSKPRNTTLMEDTLYGSGLEAEHGLSLYIETEKHKILADTGQSAKTWTNASAKKIDITKVDTVFLSHGHYDHSGGLLTFASANPSADIYIHENAGGEYFSFKEGDEIYIGIDKSILTLSNLHQIKNNTIIDEELSIFTNVSPKRHWPKGNKRLHELKNGEYVQDTFSHEMYLVIKYEQNKYILIPGCAHNGILNILDSFREIYGTDPSIVVSGFHMVQSEYTEDDLRKIKETAVELSKMDTVFYSGHCTCETAYQLLKEIMGEKLKAIRDL